MDGLLSWLEGVGVLRAGQWARGKTKLFLKVRGRQDRQGDVVPAIAQQLPPPAVLLFRRQSSLKSWRLAGRQAGRQGPC